MPNRSDYPGTPLHGQPSTATSSAAPSASPRASSFDDEAQRRQRGPTQGSESRGSGSGKAADELPFDLTDLQERATKALKLAYEKASGFVREYPRAAAGIGIAVGAILLRRATRR